LENLCRAAAQESLRDAIITKQQRTRKVTTDDFLKALEYTLPTTAPEHGQEQYINPMQLLNMFAEEGRRWQQRNPPAQ